MAETAQLPAIFAGLRVHWGLAIALAAVVGVYFLLWRTTLGFELRVCGSNPQAARFAGIPVGRCYVAAMGLGGALAGLAGAGEVLGLNRNLPARVLSAIKKDGKWLLNEEIRWLFCIHPSAILSEAIDEVRKLPTARLVQLERNMTVRRQVRMKAQEIVKRSKSRRF